MIKNYCILEWEQGYKKARHIWHHQFRRPHLVRQVQVNQLTKGQSITPAIGAVLQKIASQMLKCELTLTQMGCDADWNNPETFLGIMHRLMSNLQTKWAANTDTIFMTGGRSCFSDLASFVQQCVDIANNIFGQHLSETKSEGRTSSGYPRSNKRSESSR